MMSPTEVSGLVVLVIGLLGLAGLSVRAMRLRREELEAERLYRLAEPDYDGDGEP